MKKKIVEKEEEIDEKVEKSFRASVLKHFLMVHLLHKI